MRVQVTDPRFSHRLRAYLIGCGDAGATRTMLMRHFTVNAENLDLALNQLRGLPGFREHQPEVSFGRSPSVYVLIPPSPQGDVPTCRWCHDLLSTLVRDYCSEICERAARRGAPSREVAAFDLVSVPTAQLTLAMQALVSIALGRRGLILFRGETPGVFALGDSKTGEAQLLRIVPNNGTEGLAPWPGVTARVFRSGRVAFENLRLGLRLDENELEAVES